MGAEHQWNLFRYFLAESGTRMPIDLLLWLLEGGDPAEHGDRFDEDFGTATAGEVTPEEAGLPANRARTAAIYWPTPASIVDSLLDQVGDEATRASTFIDIGSGKGRVVLLASRRPFREVVGVELSASLHAVAEANREAWGSDPRIRFVNADAAWFELPPGPLVLFAYHPFHPSVAVELFANVAASLDADPRPLVVLYRAPRRMEAWSDELLGCGGRLKRTWKHEDRGRFTVGSRQVWRT